MTEVHHLRRGPLLLLCSLVWPVWAGDQALFFDHYTVEHGLSQSTPTVVMQDHLGYLWVGTEDGLNRFDGYHFEVFRQSEQPHSLSDNFIESLAPDPSGDLWVGTLTGGINRYDVQTGKFHRYANDGKNTIRRIRKLASDRLDPNRLWLASERSGFGWLDKTTGKIVLFPQSLDGTGLSNIQVRSLFQSADGIVWVASRRGVNRFDPKTRRFSYYLNGMDTPEDHRHITAVEGDGRSLWIGTSRGSIYRLHLAEDRLEHLSFIPPGPHKGDILAFAHDHRNPDLLWAGTFGDGLLSIDKERGTYRRTLSRPGHSGTLASDHIPSLAIDQGGGLWVGADAAGLHRLNEARMRFQHIQAGEGPFGLSGNRVNAIVQDPQQPHILWVGLFGNGLNKVDMATGEVAVFKSDSSDPNALSDNRVFHIVLDGEGLLWLGTYRGGLNRFDPKTGLFQVIPHGLETPGVTTLAMDGENDILYGGTFAGLFRRDLRTGRLSHNQSAPFNERIYGLHFGHDGHLWAGTIGHGLVRFSPDLKQHKVFKAPADGPHHPNNRILTIAEDLQGRLWVGTGGAGVARLDGTDFTGYDESDGLANNVVYGILPDRQGRLWLSTNGGLSVFDPELVHFRNFTIRDGLQSNEFNIGAHLLTADHQMAFGGIRGFNIFSPDEILPDPHRPDALITDLYLANRRAEPKWKDPTSPLEKRIDQTNVLEIGHQSRVFSLAFSAPHFTTPEQVRFAYMMEGLDHSWSETDATLRRATYTTLPPGSYRFRLKAANSDGLWSSRERVLKINIQPPPYLGFWAKSLYVTLFLTLLFTYQRRQRRKLARERDFAERERRAADQLRRLDELKDTFLANTSHELRTPLNGIIGLAEGLYHGQNLSLDDQALESLSMIITSGQRLAHLVNDILDFAKLKEDELFIERKPLSLFGEVEDVLKQSLPLTRGKNLRLINKVPFQLPPVLADKGRLQQILHNLVGNAIKFTESGNVTVSAVIQDAMRIQLSVSDTGSGIDPEEHQKIFALFHQLERPEGKQAGGTGLGLPITLKLVQLHGGELQLESVPGKGTTFRFSLETTQVKKGMTGAGLLHRVLGKQPEQRPKKEDAKILPQQPIPVQPGHRILVVDDEAVNRRVLVNQLTDRGFEVVEAHSGKQAMEKLQQPFDLVLLDVMMPGMNGYEVCRRVRERYREQQLPVLFLSARTRMDDISAGFLAGANDFLTKPVARDELLARITVHLRLLDAYRDGEQKLHGIRTSLESRENIACLGEMVGGMIHELNNPNNLINGGLQTLEMELADLGASANADCQLLADLRGQLDLIRKGSERISEVLQCMGRLSGFRDEVRCRVDLAACLRDLVALMRPLHPGLIFHLDLPEQLEWTGVPGPINRIFHDLIREASNCLARAQEDGEGTVSLSARSAESELVVLLQYRGNEGEGDGLVHHPSIERAREALAAMGATISQASADEKTCIEVCLPSDD